jgi:molybdenum cofactor cytidylyltransferase/nicotine blue oxidoreductase
VLRPAITLREVSVAAVILAAGAGTRFNRDDPDAVPGAKLLARARGKPLIEWAIAPAVEAELDELVVVSGAVDLSGVVPQGATLLRNDDWSLGQATSLRVALDWCARQGHLSAVIGLGDLPGLSAEAWRTIAAARGGPMVFATYYAKRGHPVRLDAEIWSLLPISGDEGARSLASRRPELVTEVACEGTTADIDTQEDLRRWS